MRRKGSFNDADLRCGPPEWLSETPELIRTSTSTLTTNGDARIPLPATIIMRVYKGKTLQVKVLPVGFEYEGEVYKSLSAVAKKITGTHCNGYLFFRLAKEGGEQ